MSNKPLMIGAVAYDPKVVTIWEGMREHFRASGVPIDFALYSNYEASVDALLDGKVDIAWHTPLAHVRVQRRTSGKSLSLGMRDSDRDFRAKVVVRKELGIKSLKELEGKTLAVGSRDSTQARILPLYFLRKESIDLGKVRLLPFDTDLGKHGDTGTSELDVLDALRDGRADAGTVGDLIWAQSLSTGRADGKRLEVLYTTPPFDHCSFDALPSLDADRARKFEQVLADMSWENPKHRPVLEMEGLRQWMPSRDTGYVTLREALDEEGYW